MRGYFFHHFCLTLSSLYLYYFCIQLMLIFCIREEIRPPLNHLMQLLLAKPPENVRKPEAF